MESSALSSKMPLIDYSPGKQSSWFHDFTHSFKIVFGPNIVIILLGHENDGVYVQGVTRVSTDCEK